MQPAPAHSNKEAHVPALHDRGGGRGRRGGARDGGEDWEADGDGGDEDAANGGEAGQVAVLDPAWPCAVLPSVNGSCHVVYPGRRTLHFGQAGPKQQIGEYSLFSRHPASWAASSSPALDAPHLCLLPAQPAPPTADPSSPFPSRSQLGRPGRKLVGL